MRQLYLAYAGLALLAGLVGGGRDIDWSAENKESYCGLVSRRRIYRQQRLEIYCQLKVQELDSQVCLNIATFLSQLLFYLPQSVFQSLIVFFWEGGGEIIFVVN